MSEFDFDFNIETIGSKVSTTEIFLDNKEVIEEVVKIPEKPKNEPDIRPRIRQSKLQHYFTCPRKYMLSLIYEIPTTMAMRDGLIFESNVFGHKPNTDIDDFMSNVIGKKKSATLEQIQLQANAAKKYFLNGKPFIRLEHQAQDYVLQGEADFIGTVLFDGIPTECIADLKYTSNILEFWNMKKAKREFLQAAVYPFMYYKQTGKILPFIYVIVESTYNDPLIKLIKVNVNELAFMWLEEKIEEVITDAFFMPDESEHNCLGWKGFGKCDYMEWCDAGREFVAADSVIDFEVLEN